MERNFTGNDLNNQLNDGASIHYLVPRCNMQKNVQIELAKLITASISKKYSTDAAKYKLGSEYTSNVSSLVQNLNNQAVTDEQATKLCIISVEIY